jgi:type II secretory pathway pseudopilin PulG
LIELLVVIAIIGLLASVVFASLNSARAKARDAKRAAEIRQVKTALEFYYDANGVYPPNGCQDCGAPFSGLATYLVPNYMPSLPSNPQGTAWSYVWSTNAYGLLIYREGTPSVCGTGVNWNPGWWGLGPQNCPF